MVGMEGFEPTHDGIKNRCLAAWLHPTMIVNNNNNNNNNIQVFINNFIS